jgi:hypothetical protein
LGRHLDRVQSFDWVDELWQKFKQFNDILLGTFRFAFWSSVCKLSADSSRNGIPWYPKRGWWKITGIFSWIKWPSNISRI